MGAKIGLIVSGIILLIVIVIVGWVLLAKPSIGEPTAATTDPGKLDVIELTIDANDLVAPVKSGSGAEKVYEDLVADMMKNCEGSPGDFHKTVVLNKKPETTPAYTAMLAKLEAAADQGMADDVELSFKALPVNPITEFPAWDGLYGLARMAGNIAMVDRADKKPDESAKALRATFIFGQRLYKNGVYVTYKKAGLSSMNEALAGYASQYREDMFPDKAKADRVKELQATMKEISLRFITKEKIPHANPNFMQLGDMANLAAHDKDRAWRIEGLSWLGVGQWTAARKHGQGDVIREFLQGYEASSDPFIKAAAKDARAFTRVDVQSIPTD